MDLDKLTIGELKGLRSLLSEPCSNDDSHWKVGKNYFIRTVTHHYTGRLIKVTKQELVLEDAAWIADNGRFSEALKTGEFAEVEPFQDGEVIIGRGALIDGSIYDFSLPRKTK